MNTTNLKIKTVRLIKRIFRIKNFTLYCRKKQKNIEKLFYRKKYNVDDIINVIKMSGIKPGYPIIIHSAFSNFYNYEGTADELIDKILEYIGPEGTLCMPSYPHNKKSPEIIFDIAESPSAAGYLSEVFRKRRNVKRSLNQLHSVCALGKDADYIVSDHINSKICFDEHSPYYKISELGGYTINLGMPKWYVGTAEHVCEALLFNTLTIFKEKFTKEVEFTYKLEDGSIVKHKMLTQPKVPYVRTKSTELFDNNFNKNKYSRYRLSNLWITCFDVNYLIDKLSELALLGHTIYISPKFKK